MNVRISFLAALLAMTLLVACTPEQAVQRAEQAERFAGQQIDRAEQIVAQARAAVAQAQDALVRVEAQADEARQAAAALLDQAADAAERLGVEEAQAYRERAEALAAQLVSRAEALADRARDGLEQADERLAWAQEQVPALREIQRQAQDTVAMARASVDAGGGWLDLGLELGIGVAGLLGWGGAAELLRQWRRTDQALRLTADHADRMERAETDDDARAVLDRSRTDQEMAGVRRLIQQARGKL